MGSMDETQIDVRDITAETRMVPTSGRAHATSLCRRPLSGQTRFRETRFPRETTHETTHETTVRFCEACHTALRSPVDKGAAISHNGRPRLKALQQGAD